MHIACANSCPAMLEKCKLLVVWHPPFQLRECLAGLVTMFGVMMNIITGEQIIKKRMILTIFTQPPTNPKPPQKYTNLKRRILLKSPQRTPLSSCITHSHS